MENSEPNDLHNSSLLEIDRQARQLRAKVLSDMISAAFSWLAHPSFGHRHA